MAPHIVGRATPAPNVSLYTSWLPVQGYYETLVDGPESLYAALGTTTEQYDSEEAAIAGHVRWMRKVEKTLESEGSDG